MIRFAAMKIVPFSLPRSPYDTIPLISLLYPTIHFSPRGVILTFDLLTYLNFLNAEVPFLRCCSDSKYLGIHVTMLTSFSRNEKITQARVNSPVLIYAIWSYWIDLLILLIVVNLATYFTLFRLFFFFSWTWWVGLGRYGGPISDFGVLGCGFPSFSFPFLARDRKTSF